MRQACSAVRWLSHGNTHRQPRQGDCGYAILSNALVATPWRCHWPARSAATAAGRLRLDRPACNSSPARVYARARSFYRTKRSPRRGSPPSQITCAKQQHQAMRHSIEQRPHVIDHPAPAVAAALAGANHAIDRRSAPTILCVSSIGRPGGKICSRRSRPIKPLQLLGQSFGGAAQYNLAAQIILGSKSLRPELSGPAKIAGC
jgi:hypothetical protein